MDVSMILDDGGFAVVSWAMNGVLEGIDLRICRGPGIAPELDETDVTATPEPAAFSLAGLGAAMLAFRALRRRSA